jgi:hypothetical protein
MQHHRVAYALYVQLLIENGKLPLGFVNYSLGIKE